MCIKAERIEVGCIRQLYSLSQNVEAQLLENASHSSQVRNSALIYAEFVEQAVKVKFLFVCLFYVFGQHSLAFLSVPVLASAGTQALDVHGAHQAWCTGRSACKSRVCHTDKYLSCVSTGLKLGRLSLRTGSFIMLCTASN